MARVVVAVGEGSGGTGLVLAALGMGTGLGRGLLILPFINRRPKALVLPKQLIKFIQDFWGKMMPKQQGVGKSIDKLGFRENLYLEVLWEDCLWELRFGLLGTVLKK